jgi:hypothetical protein
MPRIANNKIWNFTVKEKTLNEIYERFKNIKTEKAGTYGKKIKFKYFSVIVEHKNSGKIKVVFIKTNDNLIPIDSTDLEINDEEIIEIGYWGHSSYYFFSDKYRFNDELSKYIF